jgi:hypothetical protein
MLYLIFERNKRRDMNNSLVGFMFLFHKSPSWNHRNSFEKTLFSRKYSVWNWNIFIKVPVGTIGNYVKHTFQPKIFRLKLEYLIIKVLVGTIGKHSKRHFSAENISFEIGIFHIHVVALARISTHSVHTPIFGHCVKCCHLRNMYATCPINVQNGGWPKYFWNTKTRDLWLTSHNFFDSVEKIVTVIFWDVPARPTPGVIILDIYITAPI